MESAPEQSRPKHARPVRLLAAGGTISMQGERAVPKLDADQLIATAPSLADYELEAESVLGLPGPQLSLAQAFALTSRAVEVAAGGEGVVITTGTDTLEELAMICALTHGGEHPIVITGANRPASAAGADGPANLLDAVALAASPEAAGLGTVVLFAGEIHAGHSARKVDSTGPAAFASPVAGPLGRVLEGRTWIHARPTRPKPLAPTKLDFRVPILIASLGDDGRTFEREATDADGIVLVTFGAGHLTPGMARHLKPTVTRIPVALTCAPQRGGMLHATYGFEGAEPELRASGAVCVPFLSPAAARIALLCCLGAGLDSAATKTALAQWDS